MSAVGLSVLALPVPASASVTAKPARTWAVNGRVSVMLPVGDRIVLGGSFTSLVDPSGTSFPAKNLAVINAATGAGDLGFAASTDSGLGTEVLALATDGQRLFVGGLFKSMNGSPKSNLAAVDLFSGALVQDWNASATASVDALTVAGGNLYAGGLFANIRNPGGAQSQPYLAKLDPATGAVDTAWSVRADDRVRALTAATDNTSRLFIGGDFLNVNGLVSRRAAAVTTTDPGAVDVLFKPGPNNGTTYSQIIGLTADADHLYAAVGGGGGACTAYNGSTGSTVWSDHTNGNGQSVNLLGGLLYCGGHFGGTGSMTATNGTFDRQHLAALNTGTGAVTSGFVPKVNSALGVWSMAADNGYLYVGGDFTAITGVPQPHFAEFPVTQTVPTAPMLFAQPGNDVVHLSWSAPSTDGGSALTKYKVYQRLTTGNYSATPLATLSATTRTYDDSTVSNGTTYAYKVTAVNGVGTSPASEEQSATPKATITTTEPGAPVGLTAANPAGYVQLTWNPPTDNGGAPILHYEISRGTSPGGETALAPSDSTSYQDTSVVAGITYYYEVTAVNSVGAGLPSNEDSTTAQPGVPGPPTLTGSAGSGFVQLNWTVPPNGGTAITGYTILRDGIRYKNLTASTTSYRDTGVAGGRTYVYQVRAKNAQGNGQNSNKVTITPS